MIKVRIDGKDIEARPGTSVLEAAEAHGIQIPNLCAWKGLLPYGGCRLCLVEIKGRKGLLPACCTVVEDGLDIRSDTAELQELRRKTFELILVEHPNACLICSEKENCDDYKSTIRKVGETTGCVLCPENRRCQLQQVAEALKIDRVGFPSCYRDLEVRRDDPFFDRNYNLCILCGRCVRVCHEIRGAAAISFVFRGPRSIIGTAFDRPLLESGCQFCGACLDACPTGALAERATKGETLPEAKGEIVCPLCGMGCSLEVDISKGRILSSVPKKEDPVNDGQACVKGRFVLRDVVHSPGRILKPLLRRQGELREAGWDEALDFVAQRLKSYGVQDAALVVSSQLPLEDQYAALKLAQNVLHADAAVDLPPLSPPAIFWEERYRLGIERGINFEMNLVASAKVILVVGSDIAVAQPIVWLNILKALRKGAKLVVINAAPTALRRQASFVLKTEPGLEAELFVQLAHRLLEQEPRQNALSSSRCESPPPNLKLSFPARVSLPGVKEEDLKAVAHLLAEGHPCVFLFGASVVDVPIREAAVRALAILARLSGGRIIPLAREINERAVFELWAQASPRLLTADDLGLLIRQGRLKALYLAGAISGLGEKTLEFLVVQDSYLNDHIKLADVVLPAVTFAETEGTFANVEGRLLKFKKLIEPLGQAKPDWWIFCQLAQKMGDKNFDFKNPAEIAEELARSVPAFGGLSVRHQKKGGSAFLTEEIKAAKRFAPLGAPPPAAGNPADSSLLRGQPSSERYRSLDLREASRGLKKLRERTISGSKSSAEKKENHHG